MDAVTRTLPASWFCSPALYQLERRAIFERSWHLLGPVTRFQCRNKKIVCRIAQIKLVVDNTDPEGKGINLDGIVVYAEEKERQIKSHITPTGLVFATLSLAAPSFEEFFTGLEDLTDRVDFTKLPHRRSISYSGSFNWKTMIDGFQECLHCQYTHPSFSKLYPPATYTVTNHSNYSQHLADATKNFVSDRLFLYFFPICTLNVYGGGMSSFRTCPSEIPGVSRIEFDYYHSGTDAEFEAYFKFVRQVALEDFELCEVAQKNLEAGVYSEGILNPVKENWVVSYQGRVLEEVYAQFEREERVAEAEKKVKAMRVRGDGRTNVALENT